MIHFSKPIKFQKKSQFINYKMNDKTIKGIKKQLELLARQDQCIDAKINNRTIESNLHEQALIKIYHQKKLKENQIREKVIKLRNQHQQLAALQNPTIIHHNTKIINQYLRSLFYTQSKYQLIRQLGGIYNYNSFKLMCCYLKTKISIKPSLNKILYKRKLYFQKQWIFLTLTDHQSYLTLSIYSIVGNYYYLSQNYSPHMLSEISHKLRINSINSLQITNDQSVGKQCSIHDIEILFPDKNPIINLMILKSRSKLCFLSQYLSKDKKKDYIQTCLCKYRLKMYLQKERRKMIFYTKKTETNFFETYCGLQKDIVLDMLMVLKYEGQTAILSCETIKSYTEENTLIIQTSLKLSREYYTNRMQQYQSAKDEEVSNTSDKLKVSEECIDPKLKRNFINQMNQFLLTHIICLKNRRFIKKINFQQQIPKIVRIQSFFLMKIAQKKYLNMKKIPFNCICQIGESIRIWTYIIDGKLTIFFESISFDHRQIKFKLQYDPKYWDTINSLSTVNFADVKIDCISSYLKQRVEQQISKYQEGIRAMQLMKPMMLLNRLRKALSKISYRLLSKRNIYFIKKIQHNNNMFVIIIRKSKIVSSIYDANLYPLFNKHSFSDCRSSQNTSQGLHCNNPIRKSFPKISLFEKYLNEISRQKLIEQFYIEDNVFMLKPRQSRGVHYIRRLARVDINCPEVVRQLNVLEEDKTSVYINACLDTILHQQTYLQFSNNKHHLNTQLISFQLENQKKSDQNKRLTHYKRSQRKFTSINTQNHNKLILKNNTHRSYLYYSVLKTQHTEYFMDLYIVGIISSHLHFPSKDYSITPNEELIHLHREIIDCKQLVKSNQNLIFQIIAKQLKQNSSWLVHYSP